MGAPAWRLPTDIVQLDLDLRYPPTDRDCGLGNDCADTCETSDSDATIDLYEVYGDWFESSVTWYCRHLPGATCAPWEQPGARGATDRSEAVERVAHAAEQDTHITIGGPLLEAARELPGRQLSLLATGLAAGEMVTASSERTCPPALPPRLVITYCATVVPLAPDRR